MTTLRCVRTDYDPETERVRRVYELEAHPPAWTPPAGGRWTGEGEVRGIPMAEPDERAILQGWFAEARVGGGPARRPPWARRGWFDVAAGWMKTQLRGLTHVPVAPIEQLRAWERSCLLRACTAAGPVYLKAVPKLFAREPRLTRELAARHPARVPRLLAVDDERGWMLMADFGGRGLDRVPEVARWEEALRRYAALQIDSIGWRDRLITLGCPFRPLEDLAAGIAPLLGDTDALLLDRDGGLTSDQIVNLRALAPQLEAACAELAGYAPPYALEHGDLHPANIIATDDGDILFFDWSDSSVAHPFLSLVRDFFAEAARVLPDVPDLRARLRDAYLEPWTAFAPPERLVAAFELAQALAPLHYAVGYHRFILPRLGARWEMERMLPYFLKMLLAPESS